MKILKLILLGSTILSHYALAAVQVSSGIDYSEGKYGSQVTTKQTTIPLIAKYDAELWSAKLSIPYVWIQNVNPNSNGENLPCGNAVNTPKNVDGFGDLVASGSYSVLSADSLLVDIGAKIKFATADTDKCLSSGKNDYSISTDLVKQLNQLSLFGTLGYTFKGDPSFAGQTTNYDNPVFVSLGSSYKLSDATAIGASYDYRQKLTKTGDAIQEASTFITYKLNKQSKVQAYTVVGFSDASPDFGLGVLLSRKF